MVDAVVVSLRLLGAKPSSPCLAQCPSLGTIGVGVGAGEGEGDDMGVAADVSAFTVSELISVLLRRC